MKNLCAFSIFLLASLKFVTSSKDFLDLYQTEDKFLGQSNSLDLTVSQILPVAEDMNLVQYLDLYLGTPP